ncbi:MAG: aminopeptidase P family protein [Nitrospinae bacterium]|nr:aminopeptidase P family protein [Nitrospinota bacterium]
MIIEDRDKFAPYLEARREKLLALMEKEDVPALVVTHLPNVRYLSGFSGTAGTLLAMDGQFYFFTDFRYMSQAREQVSPLPIIESKDLNADLARTLSSGKAPTLHFEADHLAWSKAEEMKSSFKDAALKPSKGLVERLRLIKDEAEVEALQAIVDMQARVFPHALRLIRPGAKERDIAVELEHLLRQEGAEGPAFDFIVASGWRGAMPHGVASEKTLSAGELVTVDWGAKAWGYHSDNTRTMALGKVDKELEEIYRITLEANQAALDSIRPGVSVKAVDAVARDIITKAGYGPNFGHGTGHGVGLAIHERPPVSWREDIPVETGMVFTVEPGIYIPGKGGVRIEDMALATPEGARVLSQSIPKHFISI